MLLERAAKLMAFQQHLHSSMPNHHVPFNAYRYRGMDNRCSHQRGLDSPPLPHSLDCFNEDAPNAKMSDTDNVGVRLGSDVLCDCLVPANSSALKNKRRKKLKKTWEQKFALLRAFKKLFGHCNVPLNYVVDGINLGGWLETQRKEFKKHRMGLPSLIVNEKRILRLERVGIKWENPLDFHTTSNYFDFIGVHRVAPILSYRL